MEQIQFVDCPDGSKRAPLPSGGELRIITKEMDASAHADVDGVLVIDDRYTGNPSFQIVGSHAVHEPARMREILDAIIAFDRLTPTQRPWRRSMESLLKEWKLHNLAYALHVYRKSARDVDLDNRDEGKGYVHFFLVAFERVCELVWAKVRRGARKVFMRGVGGERNGR